MLGGILGRATTFGVVLLATTAISAVAAGAAGATETIIYNNIATPLPANTPSEAFEATQTSQFGGQVEFAGATTTKTKVTVGMSSWGCQSGSWTGTPECITSGSPKFSWPVTLHVYNVGTANALGSQITELTRTFNMPYRPSQNNKRCTGASKGGWYQVRTKECFHGKLFTITFGLRGVTLPSKAIISVSYNTSDYGLEPQRPKSPACETSSAGCFFDSLNVGLTEPTKFNVNKEPEPVPPFVGADPAPEDAYQNSQTAEQYCDKGLMGTGVFRLDSGLPPCWTGYQPLLTVASL